MSRFRILAATAVLFGLLGAFATITGAMNYVFTELYAPGLSFRSEFEFAQGIVLLCLSGILALVARRVRAHQKMSS